MLTCFVRILIKTNPFSFEGFDHVGIDFKYVSRIGAEYTGSMENHSEEDIENTSYIFGQ
jgi:hypothetical protein